MSPARVVIVGCGFGGLWAAQALARAPVELTVIDRTNHHLFTPLLYQVATAGLSAPSIAGPIRHILARQRNATVLYGEVRTIDPARRAIVLENGEEIAYDYLILAAGTTHSYFGHDEWAPYAPGLKTLEDAIEIRRRVLLAFEHAERERDPVKRAAWLTFVVVGGGATGVELAGTFAEIARHTLRGEFRRIDPHTARVVLVEGTGRVLPPYPPELSAKAQLALERLGVTVWPGRLVTSIDAEGVSLGEERLAAKTAIWAAGVKSSPLGATLGAPLDRAGRVQVSPDLSVPEHAEIFVAGDLAAVDGVPGIAPAAKQMGRHAALRLRRLARMARCAYLFPDQLQEPPGGHDRLGVGVLELPALRANHHSRRQEPAVVTRSRAKRRRARRLNRRACCARAASPRDRRTRSDPTGAARRYRGARYWRARRRARSRRGREG
jgi:NADH dehydrogenase